MLRNTPDNHQMNIFGTDLLQQLDPSEPLINLATRIPWQNFHEDFKKHYKEKGAPAKPIRLMVGLLILKQLHNLSDENLVVAWKQNPYYQSFCGMTEFQLTEPCHSTELVKFRNRIGKEGVEKIFQASIRIHGRYAQETVVNIDTTVQEKNITYPTDAKLAIKMINRLNKIAKKEGIKQRRTFGKDVKSLRLDIRHFRHVKKRPKARKALKRLRTIAGVLIRELRRKLPIEILNEHYESDFRFYEKVLAQKPNSKNKIYSLHEPGSYCMAKGKDRVQYEYGNKVSIATTHKSNIIVGAVSHEENIYDGHTLPDVINHIVDSRGSKPKEAVCDRGYKGKSEVQEVAITLPKPPLKRDNRYQREKKRNKCKRRAAIEPIIGHLKSDFRLSRNFLKGIQGDEINLLMSAAAWNMKKWMVSFLAIYFLLKIVLKISF